MDLRSALAELATIHQLDAPRRLRLLALADALCEPALLQRTLTRALAVLAAVLGGLGLIFWVAANWDSLSRFARFGLLQAGVVVMAIGAAWRPGARVPLGLVALLGIGGLFAYFGQTYQTGADPWQLFALWSALALPLCLGVRSDVLWAPWALVTVGAVSLWVHAHTEHSWRVEATDLPVHLVGWAAAFVVVLTLGPHLRRFTGAGIGSWRTAITLAVVALTITALGGLLHPSVAPHFWLGLLLLVVAALGSCAPRHFDLYGLSALALGINGLLVAGLARWLFEANGGGDVIGKLFLLGLVAAGLLAATVAGILRLVRRMADVETVTPARRGGR